MHGKRNQVAIPSILTGLPMPPQTPPEPQASALDGSASQRLAMVAIICAALWLLLWLVMA